MGFLSKVIKSADKLTGGFFGDFSGQAQQDNANAMALQSWNMMNDYNHPIQQMERLKAAGLNPLLVYGSGSVTGNTTGSPALTGGGVATGTQSIFRGLNAVMQAAQGKANLDQTYAQTVASNAAAGASTAQASNLNAQASLNDTRAKYEEKAQIADLDYKRALTQKLKQDGRVSAANADMVEAENRLFGSVGGAKGVSAGSGFVGAVKDAGKAIRSFMRK